MAGVKEGGKIVQLYPQAQLSQGDLERLELLRDEERVITDVLSKIPNVKDYFVKDDKSSAPVHYDIATNDGDRFVVKIYQSEDVPSAVDSKKTPSKIGELIFRWESTKATWRWIYSSKNCARSDWEYAPRNSAHCLQAGLITFDQVDDLRIRLLDGDKVK